MAWDIMYGVGVKMQHDACKGVTTCFIVCLTSIVNLHMTLL